MRDQLCSQDYWDKWISYSVESISRKVAQAKKEPDNKDFFPTYIYFISQAYLELLIRKYSRGDPISDLRPLLYSSIEWWEKSELLAHQTWSVDRLAGRNRWEDNLSFYITCFWLIGLAFVFDIPDSIWNRLISLIGNEGEDELLDSLIAVRKSDRKIGKGLCYPKPYGSLLDAIRATDSDEQARQLSDFIRRWYPELKRSSVRKFSRKKDVEPPYWYDFGTNNLSGGLYFGYWCIEAVAAVKAFGIDDRLCVGSKNYPRDLLAPEREIVNEKNIELARNEPVLKRRFWIDLFSRLKK